MNLKKLTKHVEAYKLGPKDRGSTPRTSTRLRQSAFAFDFAWLRQT